MFEDLTLIDLVKTGGFAVSVLAVFSVITLSIILGRAWAFYRFSSGLARTSGELRLLVKSGGANAGADWCREKSGGSWTDAIARVFLAGYGKRALGRDEVVSAMELTGRHQIAGLERGLGVLGTIGSTAPFVGLFGTVVGIIRAFSDLAVDTAGGPSVVAAGVSEALVATAAGLFVAIPAVIAYNFFIRSTRRQFLELETLAAEFTDCLVKEE